ncbi:NADH:ubiquinone oxidoreductase, Na(+)-translocating, C subunit [gut metagenome]|uniref:NADH:ubiquinone oxidoreductase, Na(+)-translocating, C subunit n=1 Tax=gut metagenome TaxID=749906 RepID=J9C1M1_9ZZZZ
MNTNSNSYTIIYASVLVVIVAFLLAFVSSALKPTQDKNVQLDKKKQILAALNLRDIPKDQIEAKYDEVIKADMVIKADGSVVKAGENKDQDGFNVDNKSITAENLPLYVCEINGETKYVVPMSGRGLWGGLWGYMAVNSDCATIFGTYISHESETAGLGSLIAEEKFQVLFQNKKIFSDPASSEVALHVVKKGKVEKGQEDYQVDGITGATLTTNGVDAMVNAGLQQYVGFFKANK